MYNSLKKYGLSDTKHELKFHIDKCSAYQSSKKRTQKNNPNPSCITVSYFTLDQESNQKMNRRYSILDRLLQLFQRKECQPCLSKDHDRNPLKFICLEEGCINRIGCSYCFLDNHKNHMKTDTKDSIKKLSELRSKVELSRLSLKEMLIARKTQSMKNLANLIEQIRAKFDHQIDYLQKKIEQSIETQFSLKLDQIQGKSQTSSCRLEQNEMTFITQRLDSNLKAKKDMSVNSIFQLFNNKEKSSKKYSSNNKSQNKDRSKSKVQAKVSKDVERSSMVVPEIQSQQLLQKFSRLNINYIEQYLHQQAYEMREYVQYLKVYEQFFKQLNTSLQQFFSTFKCAIPCYRSIEKCLPEPQILRGCS